MAQDFSMHRWIPGMTKVIQAAGRLLRSAEDKGTIVLIDADFYGETTWHFYLNGGILSTRKTL